jgi:hypothetical protein
LNELDIRNNNLAVAGIIEVVYAMRESESLQRVHFMNEKGKWPLNSRYYLDLQSQLGIMMPERKVEVEKVRDVISIENK